MILVNTDYISGKEFEMLGLVKGSTIQSKHVGKDIAQSFKTLVGGELKAYNEIKFGCLKNFDRYNAYLVSNDEELRTKVLNKTNKIFRTKETAIFTNQNATYNELLLRKIMEVHYIEDISAFLVDEYNRLK